MPIDESSTTTHPSTSSLNHSRPAGQMELLAPAGSYEAFKAAVENGADAIYLGGKSFNARASAANFGLEELREVIRYAHERRVKVYVTVNILIADQEFPELTDYLYKLYELGADAVILQDPGVAWFVDMVFPEFEKHASTQMTVNTTGGVRQLESMGFARAVLAREVSALEMAAICASTPLEIEVFVHGALCICYSGQCLMSSFIGGRSGNRGTCAQPCRMTYELVDRKRENALQDRGIGEHLLSPRDLNLAQELKALKEAGVDSLKLEGRMKRPEYVATVTRIYGQALARLNDTLPGAQEGSLSAQERHELTQIFNRDFTTAYFQTHPGAALMSYHRPNNRGTRLGRVLGSENGYLRMKLEASLHLGDGIEIWTGQGREGLTVESIGQPEHKPGKAEVQLDVAESGATVEIPFAGRAYTGDRVFKTHDALLMEKAQLSFQEGREKRKYPLAMRLAGRSEEQLVLEVSDGVQTLEVRSTEKAQIARKRPLTKDYLLQQLGRLGTTPYYLDQLEVDVEGELMLPVSDLNEMRRKAVAALLAPSRSKPEVSESVYQERVKTWRSVVKSIRREHSTGRKKPIVAVTVSDLEGLKMALRAGAGKILFGGENWRSRRGFSLTDIQQGTALCLEAGVQGVWRLPRILNESQSTRARTLLDKASHWSERPLLMAGNLGELALIRTVDSKWPVAVDFSLNVFNEASIAYFLSQNAEIITLSPELNQGQLKVLGQWPAVQLLAFGDLEMMVSEYCPIGATLGEKSGDRCSKPCLNEPYFLRDRLNYEFPIETDVECRMHLFNAKRLNLYAELEGIAQMGIRDIRLQLVRATSKQLEDTVSLFAKAWPEACSANGRSERAIQDGILRLQGLYPEGFTKGHYFRGVL